MDSKDAITNSSVTTQRRFSLDNLHFDINHFQKVTLLNKTFREFLPEQTPETKIVQQVRKILGNDYSSEEIKEMIASFEYLIHNWIEEYEKAVFNNKTLNDLLQTI